MKKVFSILLVILMMVFILIIPSYAADSVIENKYYDVFVENIDCPYEPWEYEEIYIHYSVETSEEPAWVMIYAMCEDDMSTKSYGVVAGNRIILTDSFDTYSLSRVYVYIPALDELLYVDNTQIEEVIVKCPGFLEALEKQDIGQLIGDINDNSEIDIVDATLIQRYLAGYDDTVESRYSFSSRFRVSGKFSNKDRVGTSYAVNGQHVKVWEYDYISDFDRDGERTILDATAIQLKLAGLEQ